jgi:predicted DNA-binding protein (UPF0251 family)
MKNLSPAKVKEWEEIIDIPILNEWDNHLTFKPPEKLEQMQNASNRQPKPTGYFHRRDYAHLKDVKLNLGKLNLTDRQLLAVSLVFYGRVTKARAARAMKISPQSLSENIQAALKKIQKVVEGNTAKPEETKNKGESV